MIHQHHQYGIILQSHECESQKQKQSALVLRCPLLGAYCTRHIIKLEEHFISLSVVKEKRNNSCSLPENQCETIGADTYFSKSSQQMKCFEMALTSDAQLTPMNINNGCGMVLPGPY